MKDIIRHAVHDDVPPLIDGNSKVLLLGSMLSPKSAEARFYYAHPQNRFWRVLAALFDEQPPADNVKRARLALSHGIALWDVIRSCDIVGALDNTIKNVVYNDVKDLTERYPSIKRVFATGAKAHALLMKYAETAGSPVVSTAVRLPSTSPQNFGYSLDRLVAEYSVIKSDL